MILYSYWRSTTSYRVRAALNLKGIAYEQRAVDLVAGDQRTPDYMAVNPAKGVPALELEDGTLLTQSLAILDYLDARQPEPPLLPAEPLLRARVLAVAHSIALDIHPVNNLRVLGHLMGHFDATSEDARAWMCHWMTEGLTAVEALLPTRADFAFTEAPGLADLCITAQCYNAHRWGLSLDPFPKIARVEAACLALPEIRAAAPEAQPDAP
ncbi:maleylacetoacetate isomerase [Gymnodinialimonas ceratoperidinii]|uniref:Maleylacetoacetate isomerase n=1 Tax=Gymnodinialimonas ceratoperidinii TaxID=2856823 RepID=A0A8F6TW57_9RHOB|nr:maleylacetoacetate isomerase [Gymnodinialimonas ceratoperidinii]QXT39014.1 maleylacetoacetate isomerase [Gymnodinialimonas ceratoperidinii]